MISAILILTNDLMFVCIFLIFSINNKNIRIKRPKFCQVTVGFQYIDGILKQKLFRM